MRWTTPEARASCDYVTASRTGALPAARMGRELRGATLGVILRGQTPPGAVNMEHARRLATL